MRRLRMPRKWLVAAGMLLAAAVAGGAFAAFPDTNVDTYTGCLNVGGSAGGTVSQIQTGLSPLKACGSNQKAIHLSGGDISKVTAGAGLAGGGDNGAVTLSLAGGYQLPQSCATGKIPQWDGSAWQCADDQTYTNGDGLDLSGKTFSIDPNYQLPQSCSSGQEPRWDGSKWACGDASVNGGIFGSGFDGWDSDGAHDIGSIDVGKGNWLITVRLLLHAQDDATLTCYLHEEFQSGEVDETLTALEGDSTVGTNANWQTTVLMASVVGPDTYTVSCDSPGGKQDARFIASGIRLS